MPREFDELESRVPPSLNAPFRDFSNYYAQLRSGDAAPGMAHTGPDPRKEKAGAFARGVKDALVSSVTAPFDITNKAIRGGYGGDNERMAEDIFKEITLPMAGTGTQFAVKGAAGIFGGRLAPGAPRGKLDVAQILEKRGATPEDIWYQTGWFKGHDKKWKFEIPDTLAEVKLLGPAGVEGKLSEFLHHPKLYEAYPDLANLSTMRDPNLKSVGAYWSPDPKTGSPAAMSFKETDYGRRGDTLGTLLHETQHGIQDIEGFARGTSSAGRLREGTPAWQVYEDKIRSLVRATGRREIGPEEARFLREQSMKEGYQRSAGEVEARNVERRMDMRPGQLEAAPPWWTEYQDTLLGGRHPLVGRQFGGPVGPGVPPSLNDIPSRIEQAFRLLGNKAYRPEEYQDDEPEISQNPANVLRTPLGPRVADELDLATPEQRREWGKLRRVLDFAPSTVRDELHVKEPVSLETRDRILKQLGLERREFGGEVKGQAGGGVRAQQFIPLDQRPPLPPGLYYEDQPPSEQQFIPLDQRPTLPPGFYWEDQPPTVQPRPGAMAPPGGPPKPLSFPRSGARPPGAPASLTEPPLEPVQKPMLPPGGITPPMATQGGPPASLVPPEGPIPGAMAPPGGALPPGVIPRSGPESPPEIVQRRGQLYEAGRGGRMLPPPPLPQAAPPEIRQFSPPQGPPVGFQGQRPIVQRGGRLYTVDDQGNLIPLPAAEMGQ